MRRVRSPVTVALLAVTIMAVNAPAASTAKKALPDTSALVTQADVTAAFGKLDPTLQPTSVSDPVSSGASKTGGSCETQTRVPELGGRQGVGAGERGAKKTQCPNRAAPARRSRFPGRRHCSSRPREDTSIVRDVTFLRSGHVRADPGPVERRQDAKVPASGFVDLATSALAKKAPSTTKNHRGHSCVHARRPRRRRLGARPARQRQRRQVERIGASTARPATPTPSRSP